MSIYEYVFAQYFSTVLSGRKGNLANEEAGENRQDQCGRRHAAEAERERRENVEPAGAVSGTDARLSERVGLSHIQQHNSVQ